MPKVSLTKSQKKQLCLHAETLPKTKESKCKILARWAKEEFGLEKAPGTSTISDILKLRDRLLAMSDNELTGKRTRRPELPQLEEVLAKFVNDMAAVGTPVSRRLLELEARNQAKILDIKLRPGFKFSVGWMTNFMRRHEFKSHPIHEVGNVINIDHDDVQQVKAKIDECQPERENAA